MKQDRTDRKEHRMSLAVKMNLAVRNNLTI